MVKCQGRESHTNVGLCINAMLKLHGSPNSVTAIGTAYLVIIIVEVIHVIVVVRCDRIIIFPMYEFCIEPRFGCSTLFSLRQMLIIHIKPL